MSEAAPHILVVEDEAALAELIRYNLVSQGLRVTTAATAEDAEVLVAEEHFDLVVLDWMLPGVSGLEFCRRLRKREATQSIPVLMLTARGEEADRVRGLAIGADDYVVKPFSVPEILARIKALLRRAAPQRLADTLQRGDIVLDRAAHRVTRRTREVRLGPTEFKLLVFFMENAGRVLTRQQLLDGVWGRDAFIDGRTVDVHVGRLRKALIRGSDTDPIRTVRGTGYAFNGDSG
ncbi:MAG TPA: phosphate regulon transcriptional regulator PhoB [Hyphomicrobiaceae bacterium]|nr:phosphate regulon transcriptional regulator PhoB [Hyphomicrobiaceae bacterium]